MTEYYDVIVVGGGNAGLSAAHAAREQVDKVLVLEKAGSDWAGGNSYFTAGAFRTTFSSLEELLPLLDERDEAFLQRTALPPYTPEQFLQDMQRTTKGRCDPELTAILVQEAAETIRWLHQKGLRFRLMYDRQSFQVDGEFRFWGGLALGTVNGGKGLIEQHLQAAAASGIEVRFNSPVVDLECDMTGAVCGVICSPPGRERQRIRAGAVVLAAGGFEANPQLRTCYLGPGWDLARVRGTPYNTGEVLFAALALGAQSYGHWSGCHSVAWDVAAPPHGDRFLTNLLTKQSYPLGIVVNSQGKRFLDEGADFRNYTYARYGAEIMKQPDGIAFQLFDAKTEPLLRKDEYTAPGVSRFEALTIRELAQKAGIDADGLEETVTTFNAAVMRDVKFNPAIKDGKGTVGITPRKSNWAQPLDTPPYYAFAVTCGITFTFGGLRIDPNGRVLDRLNLPMPGLYAAGELVGGLFYHNYPGGAGLMAGSVFGRRAGRAAGQWSRERRALDRAS
ncbi:FAD-dependent tricarballylate dehydrogenase TcuA [Thermogemmatispora tikiterensis]|uniref:Tricarballylate dehydrogenase n=1 Tax=Thermogemmatispora tikiterensis TaxID=1825093 RepID=A0A328VJR1_9CHLR|nr:FAD-dependent tricarballylate dehydrogenase TcuA [Thermogemmatispora tikiterensis]RAQ97707.1 tricarballylate dehydrogenase [Thermogemmatispora tikiterensis]